MFRQPRLKVDCAYGDDCALIISKSAKVKEVWVEFHSGQSIQSLKLNKEGIRCLMGFLLEVLTDG